MRSVIKLYVRALFALRRCQARIMSTVRYSDDDDSSAVGQRHYMETMLLRDTIARTAEYSEYCTLQPDFVRTFTGF